MGVQAEEVGDLDDEEGQPGRRHRQTALANNEFALRLHREINVPVQTPDNWIQRKRCVSIPILPPDRMSVPFMAIAITILRPSKVVVEGGQDDEEPRHEGHDPPKDQMAARRLGARIEGC